MDIGEVMKTRDKINVGTLEADEATIAEVTIVSAEAGTMTAKSPETDVEAAFITVTIGGTTYEIPAYAIA